MQFVVTAYDGKGMLEKRMSVRSRHLEGIARMMDHVTVAGGILDDEGKPKGSVLVLDFDNRAELDDYLAAEPYIVEGVWETVTVEPMNVVILKGEKVGR
ncbi:MAG: hypothetical protein IJJ14_00520 [Coriobacteriales bacterium]|nr:hypothetical protein [Coriobacteriales bacterium]MBQ6585846.1 hypothetical protein [Coriobacteriales bacterium]